MIYEKMLKTLLPSGVLLSSFVLSTFATDFDDVPSSYWASGYIQTAVEADLVTGMGNNLFSPETEMSYEQFAVMVVKGAYPEDLTFKDSELHWSDPYIRVVLEKKLLESSDVLVVDTTADNWQEKPIPREDVATMVANVLGEQGKDSGSFSATFSDLFHDSLVENQWADLVLVKGMGIMSGMTDSAFGVGEAFTRAQACVVLNAMLAVRAGFLCYKTQFLAMLLNMLSPKTRCKRETIGTLALIGVW